MAIATARSAFDNESTVITVEYDDVSAEVSTIFWSNSKSTSALFVTDGRSFDLSPGLNHSINIPRNQRPKMTNPIFMGPL